MATFRRMLLTCALVASAMTAPAARSYAIVGGSNAGPAEFPAVAQISSGRSSSSTARARSSRPTRC